MQLVALVAAVLRVCVAEFQLVVMVVVSGEVVRGAGSRGRSATVVVVAVSVPT